MKLGRIRADGHRRGRRARQRDCAERALHVSTRYGGRKNPTAIDWSAEQLVAEELACVLAIRDACISDGGVPVWEILTLYAFLEALLHA